jgi:hypothetical protein
MAPGGIMSLYNLKREYEERRRALVEQLQKNPSLDPATQHQIYGAIKEIENFLKTIDFQISSEQDKNLNVELERARPNPFVERTKGAVYHVVGGTKKVFTHHIPNAARSVASVPKKYWDRKKEESRLRAEIEAEVRARQAAHRQQLAHTTEHVTLEHPHQELAQKHESVQVVPIDETVNKPIEASSQKRPKSFVSPKKGKNRPSKRAHDKHPHKPHLKKEKFTRGHRR